MPDPSHFQHAENMHNIPGAAGGAGAQQQAQPQTFGGHGGKYVPPPPPPPILPRLWPKAADGSEAKDGEKASKDKDGKSLEDKIAKIKDALKEFHKDEL